MPLTTAAARSPPAPVPSATAALGDSEIDVVGDRTMNLAAAMAGQLRRQIKPYVDDAIMDPYRGEPLAVHGLPSRRLWHRVMSWTRLGLVAGAGGVVLGVGMAVCAAGLALLVGAILMLARAIIYAAEAVGLCALATLLLRAAGLLSSGSGRRRRR